MNYFPALSLAQKDHLQTIAQLFLEENKKVNLSSIRSENGVWEKHILDSLAGSEFLKNKSLSSLKALDFGTGGGFPALPLAVMHPEVCFFAIDSVAKKLRAVEEIARNSEMKNIRILLGRGEEFARKPQYRESFDFVFSRAAAKFSVLLEITSPFLKTGGELVSYRGPESMNDDIPLAEKLNLKFIHKKEYELSGGEKRSIWVFQKIGQSSRLFPRETGIPKKYPLVLGDFSRGK